MTQMYLIDLQTATRLNQVGPKAAGVHWLIRQGAQVPRSLACTYAAEALFNGRGSQELAGFKEQLQAWLDAETAYAVRSAASLEDSQAASFAGQFSSTLHVHGVEAVIETIASTFASRLSPGVQTYMAKIGLDVSELKMSVLIQEMVRPLFSGVSFSKNPLTGLDEVIVETIQGDGTSLLQGGATPQRWVDKWGKWIEAPAEPEIPPELAAEIVSQTRKWAALWGSPVDLEWVYDGHEIYWVQLREISSIDQIDIYSNRIAREVLPGMIKPLVWSVNIPGVNGAWCDLFTELIGPHQIEPEHLAKAFYYRAYFNMGTIGSVFQELGMPAETLELMMGIEGGEDRPRFRPRGHIWRHTGRLLRFLFNKLTFARQVKRTLPELREAFARFDIDRVSELDDRTVSQHLDRLAGLYRRTAYLNIVIPLLMMAYDGWWRKILQGLSLEPEQFDLMHGVEALAQYDPNIQLHQLHTQFKQLDLSLQRRIRQGSYEAFQQLPGLERFQEEVTQFMARFGHLSDSGNDFSKRPWREDKEIILQLIANIGEERDAHQRITWEELKLSRWQRLSYGLLFKRARQFRLYREAVSALYTYGYGLFRAYFLQLGTRLARRNLIDTPEDIFYLYLPEVRQAVAAAAPQDSFRERVAQHKAVMATTQDFVLPDIIYGDRPPPLESFDGTHRRLSGVPTSRGYYQGEARVIQSIAEFETLNEGDVLVIPFSDVSWTPLFAKAGAVIAESGGTLSHSSIVAREYNIPAVVSVSGACRIPNRTWVTVDGFKGEILLHQAANGDMP